MNVAHRADEHRAKEAADRPTVPAGNVYDRLRENLIIGAFAPGTKLKPQYLKDQLSCTTGVVREALIRLAGEGLVDFESQRGFRAIVPTEKSFYEVTHLRTLIECEGARLSIQNGDMDWEADLIAAHHKLAHLEERMRSEADLRSLLEVWSRYEWTFHSTLLSACGSDLLKEQHRAIFDKFRLHLLAKARSFGFRGEVTIREHGDILAAALARDVDACQQAIQKHFRIYRSRAAGSHPQGNLLQQA